MFLAIVCDPGGDYGPCVWSAEFASEFNAEEAARFVKSNMGPNACYKVVQTAQVTEGP